jgi:hypothetical protein
MMSRKLGNAFMITEEIEADLFHDMRNRGVYDVEVPGWEELNEFFDAIKDIIIEATEYWIDTECYAQKKPII